MKIFNIKYFGGDHRFHDGSLLLKGDTIAALRNEAVGGAGNSGTAEIPTAAGQAGAADIPAAAENSDAAAAGHPAGVVSASEELLDGQGCFCIPGLIDLQFTGAGGRSFAGADLDGCDIMAHDALLSGVTAFTAALPREPEERLLQRAAQADGYMAEQLRREGCKHCRSCESYQPDSPGFQPMADCLGCAPEFPREEPDEALLKNLLREGNGNVIFPDRTALSPDTPFIPGTEHTAEALLQELKDRVKRGEASEKVIPLFTEEPAQALRIAAERGSISQGKKADLLLLDADFNLKCVVKGGEAGL